MTMQWNRFYLNIISLLVFTALYCAKIISNAPIVVSVDIIISWLILSLPHLRAVPRTAGCASRCGSATGLIRKT